MDDNTPVIVTRITYRLLRDTPGHATFGIWINGAKSGDLTVRQNERASFERWMQWAGFEEYARGAE